MHRNCGASDRCCGQCLLGERTTGGGELCLQRPFGDAEAVAVMRNQCADDRLLACEAGISLPRRGTAEKKSQKSAQNMKVCGFPAWTERRARFTGLLKRPKLLAKLLDTFLPVREV